MVGNGVTDDVFDGNALVPFAHGMGLISDDLFEVCTILVLFRSGLSTLSMMFLLYVQ